MDAVSRDRARWDSLYDREKGTSSTDDEGMKRPYASLSDRHISSEDMEMSDLGSDREIHESGISTNKTPSRLGVTITTVEAQDEDEIRQIDGPQDVTRLSMNEQSPVQIRQESLETTERPLSTVGSAVVDNPSVVSIPQVVVPAPSVVPLPFRVPVGSDEEPKRAASNVGSKIESLSRRLSGKRASVASSLNRRSFQSLPDAGPSQEDLIARHLDDDGSSSIAATIDLLDVDDLCPDALPEPRSPLDPNFAPQQLHVPGKTGEGASLETVEQGSRHLRPNAEELRKSMVESLRLSMLSDDDEERLKPEEDVQDELKPNDSVSRPVSLQSALLERRNSLKSAVAKSEVSRAETLETLRSNVPELPKNLMIYRTNEWAKHAADAEEPTVEEIERPESPGVQVQHEKPQQNPRKLPPAEAPTDTTTAEPPLNTAAPQMSADRTSSGALPRPTSAPASRNQSTPNLPQATPTSSDHQYTSRNSSTPNVTRGISFQKRNAARESRNSSTPMLNTTVNEEESDGAALGHRRQTTDVLTPLPGDTLLDKRNSKLKARVSTQSFANLSSTGVPTYAFSSTPDLRTMTPVTPDDSASIRNAAIDDAAAVDLDDVPLAARKVRLQSRSSSALSMAQPGSRHASWSGLPQMPGSSGSNGPAAAPGMEAAAAPRIQRNNSSFDAAKRDSNTQQWRASLTRDAGERPIADEARRLVMIESKRRSEAMRQFAQMEKRSRDDAFDRSMRSGAMVSRHNELMRKMEASVPKE